MLDLFWKPCFIQGAIHQLNPPVASALPDRKRGVTHAEAGVTALFDVERRPPESIHQKVLEPLFRSLEIVRGIHRTQNIIAGNLAVERGDQALKPLGADHGVNFVFFHYYFFCWGRGSEAGGTMFFIRRYTTMLP